MLPDSMYNSNMFRRVAGSGLPVILPVIGKDKKK